MGTCRFSEMETRFGSFSAFMRPCLMRKSRTMGALGVLGKIQNTFEAQDHMRPLEMRNKASKGHVDEATEFKNALATCNIPESVLDTYLKLRGAYLRHNILHRDKFESLDFTVVILGDEILRLEEYLI